jgi:hypothetical protein
MATFCSRGLDGLMARGVRYDWAVNTTDCEFRHTHTTVLFAL